MRHDSDDTLVVAGSGVAGLSAALAAATLGARVSLLTDGAPLSGSSPWAQGGIAAALGPDDTLALHAADTLGVGAGINDSGAVRVLVHDGRDAVRALLAAGVPFDGGPSSPELGLEAGHSRRRIVHAGGGATGRAVTTSLLARVAAHPRITVHDHTPAEALVVERGRVVGVRAGSAVHGGRAVVLATGGYAALWGRTTNAPESRGTGLALAWWAGASLADLEFVQFHPTALSLPGRPAFLLSEALRGEGALIVAADGAPVVDPLLPRDVVARAIARYLRESGPVYLSLRHLDAARVHEHFPTIAARLREWGLDLARDLLPIAPAAHYCMGGVRSDADGRTDLPGLYVAGEAACTGVQGANRLASNSLLECLVFGRRAARAALGDAPERCARWETGALPLQEDWRDEAMAQPATEVAWQTAGRLRSGERSSGSLLQSNPSEKPPAADIPAKRVALGDMLDRDLGVERDGARLDALLARLPDPEGETPPARVIAALAARAALLRAESRGAHYRADTPETKEEWRGHIHWRRGLPPRFERIAP